MPRPKTKGPLLQVRLPFALHRQLVEMAGDGSVNMTASALLEKALERGLTARVYYADPECKHMRRTMDAAGRVACRACAATRDADGTWHAVD
jgi:hypothetical protein